MSTKHDVIIVGGGFSGIATLLNLVRFSKTSLNIAIIERDSKFLGTGLAYNCNVIDPVHMLNIQPSRMSVFSDQPSHFCGWLEKSNKTDWPAEYQSLSDKSYNVPRPVYGMYIADQFQKARLDRKHTIDVITDQSAIRTNVRNCEAFVGLSDGRELSGKQVVLATGNILVKKTAFTKNVENSSYYIGDRWSVEAKERVRTIPTQGDILILGTGAAMFDTLCNINEQGHRGSVLALSRNGYINGFYKDKYYPEKPSISAPDFTQEELADVDLFAKRVNEEYAAAAAQLPDDGRMKSEEIMSAWEDAIPDLVSRMPFENITALFNRYGSLLATRRLGLLPATVKHYSEMKSRDQIQIDAAHIINMEPVHKGINVTYRSKNTGAITKHFSSVINCMGQELDYNEIAKTDKLWNNLINAQGLTAPHKMGYGVSVGKNGELQGVDGALTEQIIAVGPMRGADTTLRRGKLGLLAQSVETLRLQAQEAASYTLQKLQHPPSASTNFEL